MIKLPRQPLLWFAIAGVLLFVIDARIVTDRKQIIVTTAQQQRLATLWETQTGAMASPKELSSLISNWIQEEILYREALRLGLDEQDSIVRRRLIQKLGFIAESDSEELVDERTTTRYVQVEKSDYVDDGLDNAFFDEPPELGYPRPLEDDSEFDEGIEFDEEDESNFWCK